MELSSIVILFFAGVVGGGANAIAGGGTFITFPALIASGLDPLTANVSNAVAIYPGHAAAVPAYRKELAAAGKPLAIRSGVVATGSLVGAGLLVFTDPAAFEALIPYLLLSATILFAFGRFLAELSASLRSDSSWVAGAIEFLFAIYGGYFGAGLGILLMAALTIIGISDLQMANAQKNWLATVITTISVAVFAVSGVVAWPQTLMVLSGALIGGYFGARIGRHIATRGLRITVISAGLFLSVYYFLH